MVCIRGHVYCLNTIGVTYCSHLVYSNEIKEINMFSNTCHFKLFCDTHAEKYNTALNSNPWQILSSIILSIDSRGVNMSDECEMKASLK